MQEEIKWEWLPDSLHGNVWLSFGWGDWIIDSQSYTEGTKTRPIARQRWIAYHKGKRRGSFETQQEAQEFCENRPIG